ncbi:MAG: glycosyltransferase family 4 protein [Leptolyngbyaceae cyanobacterium]
MIILTVHNRYQFRGGEDAVLEAEDNLLRDRGNETIRYEAHNDEIERLGKLRTSFRTIWSQDSIQRLDKILLNKHADIMHVHNFFPLISPSIYYAAKRHNIPVVQTIHNYRLFCLNGYFFRQDKTCEDCLGKLVPWPGVVHACYRESMAGSAVVATMLATHRLMKTWLNQVDIFIALTEFSRSKLIEGGLPEYKIIVKSNFLDRDPGVGDGCGGYALFVGRLSPEKGINTLINAWKENKSAPPLKIVGDGPLSTEVLKASMSVPKIEWLGQQPPETVYDFMGAASFLVFPSQWYEGLPRTIIESFAKGTPVIASKIGATTELIEPGRTGLLFETGNPRDLIEKVDWAMAYPKKMAEMRREARAEFEAKYTSERNYKMLMDIYQQAI